METIGTYDPQTDEIVVHSPTDMAQKIWIGNAAKYGHIAVVFLQLFVHDVCHGVHAVIVPIRHRDGTVCEGVYVADCGVKEGTKSLAISFVCCFLLFIRLFVVACFVAVVDISVFLYVQMVLIRSPSL